MGFVDKCKIFVKAGNGGNGCLSWRKEAHVPLGGPAGGNGGNGGSIFFIGDRNETSLEHLQYKKNIFAKNGENGGIKNMHGKNAEDLYIKVPLGTIVYNIDKSQPICDIKKHNESYLIALGGKGGHGNTHFKSSFNKAPSLFENGEIGESLNVILDLKEIADIGIIGFPNAGKSSLISKITNAKPKIANYSFTTLIPILGTLDCNNKKIIIADIPGLVENASNGYGLGFEFLKHIERCKILIHLISLDNNDNEDIIKSYTTIMKELESYNIKLLDKKIILIANKKDVLDSKKQLNELEKFLQKKVTSISCYSDDDILFVKKLILKEYDELINKDNFEIEPVLWQEQVGKEKELDKKLIITKLEDGVWDIKCEYLEYWTNRIPLKSPDNIIRYNQKIKSLEIEKELYKNGAKKSDVFFIYGNEVVLDD